MSFAAFAQVASIGLRDLPSIDAGLNALSTVFILLGWRFIQRGRQRRHIAMMTCALTASTLFLACYLTYHLSVPPVAFTGRGLIRPVYFAILISHVGLAFVTVPMVIMTVTPALRGRYDRHRQIARWTLPVWLYVSVTGVVVYAMLYRM